MQGADVRSIVVLREWMAGLTNYHDDVAETLAGIRTEIRRAEEWVENQLALWQQAVREAEDAVHEAKQELAAKKVPGPTGKMPDTTLEERALRRARAWLEHCQDKVRVCKSWVSRLPKMVDELYSGASHRLQAFLDGELARGQAVLGRQVEALEKYAEVTADLGAPKLNSAAVTPPKKEGTP